MEREPLQRDDLDSVFAQGFSLQPDDGQCLGLFEKEDTDINFASK